jgi:hypothetical protein
VKGQDHYTTVVIYIKSTNVCRSLNFTTGVVSEGTNSSGFPTGTISSAFRSSTGHSGSVSKDGKWVVISAQSCSAGCTGFVNGSAVLWNVEDNTIYSTGPTGFGQGHGALGNHSLVSTYNPVPIQVQVFDLTAVPLVSNLRATPKGNVEHYVSWANVDAGDTYSILFSQFHIDGYIASTKALENELTMIKTTGPTNIWSRQAKICTYDTTGTFNRRQPRVVASPDGRFSMHPDRGNACSQDIGEYDLYITELR